jgi:hypothetical protein
VKNKLSDLQNHFFEMIETLNDPELETELPSAEPETNNTEEKEIVKNKWQDLNDHLFEQLEWLTDRDIKGGELTEEIKRAQMVVKVSDQILKGFDLYHRASSSVAKFGGKMKLPMMIEDKDK